MEIDFTDIEAAINHLVSDLRSLEDQQLLRPVLKISSLLAEVSHDEAKMSASREENFEQGEMYIVHTE